MSKSKKVSIRKPKHSKAGKSIMSALQEFLEAVDAGKPLTMRRYRFQLPQAEYGPADVRRVRHSYGMSQAVFAVFLGVDSGTVKAWEQGQKNPSGLARRFLSELEAEPKYWAGRIERCLAGQTSVEPLSKPRPVRPAKTAAHPARTR
jgi:putative transcriptional regulator